MKLNKLFLILPLLISACSSPQDKEIFEKVCSQNISKDYDFVYFNESPTDSMYPTINKTSIAYFEKVTDKTELKKGDIINFKVPKRLGCTWVHRIIKIKEDNKGIYYITKGDNNWMFDIQKTRREDDLFKITKIV